MIRRSVATLLLVLVGAAPVHAACTFGGAITDVITVAAAATINDLSPRTWCQWNRPTSDIGLQVFMAKGVQADLKRVSTDVNEISWRVHRLTTNALADTTGINRPLNAWQAFCGNWLIDILPAVVWGTETTTMAGASYGTRNGGSGTLVSDAAAAALIGNDTTNVGSFVGRIAVSVMVATAWTDTMMNAYMHRPRAWPDVRLLQLAGLPSCSGTQGDFSGNGNTGTPSLTSTTFADGPVINYRHPGAGRRR